MKLVYLLLEALNINVMRQLKLISTSLDIPEQILIDSINDIDPSNKYVEWVLRQIRFKNIRVPEDNNRVKEVINQFKQHQSRLQQKDLNQYKTIHDVEEALEKVTSTGSKREGAFQVNPEELNGVRLLNQDGNYKLWEISDPESLSLMGEGTKWCTRKSYKPCQAKNYIDEQGVIYIISKGNIPIIQFTSDFEQVMDRNDSEVELTSYRQLLKILEQTIMMNSERAYFYAVNTIKGRWPEAEPYIMKNPIYAYIYARDVINGRWLKAESYIMKNPENAYSYARDVIKGRWPEAEPYIMKNPEIAYIYAMNILEERWPEAEQIIKNTHVAYVYAANVIKGRWPEAEPYIMKNPENAYSYAMDVIKGRWPEAEPTIIKNTYTAYAYAKNVIEGRWPEAEDTIAKDPQMAYIYARDVIKGRWPEAEPIIMKDPTYALAYAYVPLR